MAITVMAACDQRSDSPSSAATQSPSAAVPASVSSPSSASAAPFASSPPAPEQGPVILLAGGDVDLSRRTGQRILRDPSLDFLAGVRPLFVSADVRFANLESQLCELGGVTGSPTQPLVFAGPPSGAEVLQRSLFDVVSTANNHAWDYGKRCLVETLDNLRRVGIQAVGTDAAGEDPLRPVILERRGQKLAFFATTVIFNDGPLPRHKAGAYVAYADMGALARRIAAIRSQVDWVIVSVHLGEEYMHEPIEANRYVLVAAAEAGADVVLGHHPHTPQRVEFHKGKPIAFSLGNLVFHQNSLHPWTGFGVLARLTLDRGQAPRIEVCPYHLVDAAAKPLTEKLETLFFAHWDAISVGAKAARRGARAADGCVTLERKGQD